MIGRMLGPYHVVEKLGEGGMGEVYRAHDTKLNRDVALKILPESLAGDPDRLRRFEREAKTLAALNHPHVAQVYGFEDGGETRALVMELVPGESVATRLQRGPVPVREALELARQVAEGLEAAHEKGIIHRDLKPANLQLMPDGAVKILDFGLAKEVDVGADSERGEVLTITARTQDGVVMGTAAYMSPEQARGLAVDARTDVWAFGCVLFEMLTATRAFAGATVTDTLAAVLEREPDWGRVSAATPPAVRALLQRCLKKDVRQRLRHVADARFAIEEALAAWTSGPTAIAGALAPAAPSRAARGIWRRLLPFAAAVAMLALGLAMGWGLGLARRQAPPAQLVRLSIPLAQDGPLVSTLNPRGGSSVALSRDGRRLVYRSKRNGESVLVLRAIDRIEETVLRGTEGAFGPFFSPDGNWVAYFTESELRKVPLDGGASVTICATPPVGRGGSWADDDTIYFAPDFTSGIQRVAADGGRPQAVTTPDPAAKESNHLYPEALPGGGALLFTVWKGGAFDAASTWALSLRTGKRTLLLERAAEARYTSEGYLVFARAGTLLAVPFDAVTLTILGPAAPLVEGVWSDSASGTAHYAVSRTGSLVYAPGLYTEARRRIAWVDRRGRLDFLPLQPGFYGDPKLSPDGRRLAVQLLNDIWVYDFAGGTLTRATFRGVNQAPVWTPDGRRIAFSSSQDVARAALYWVDPAGGEPEILSRDGEVQFPSSWSPDGTLLAYAEIKQQDDTETGFDIWLLRGGAPWTRQVLIRTPFKEDQPMFSPDGRALAWVSNETGRSQVYVRPYPGAGRTMVSTDGGTEPIWSRAGTELYYRNGRRFFSIPIRTSGPLTVGRPSALFEGDFAAGSITPGIPAFDAAPDGQRFIVVTSTSDAESPTRLDVVLNWTEELRRKASRQPARSPVLIPPDAR
jgi:eukaryotic-like serine/threonine-protein kinase